MKNTTDLLQGDIKKHMIRMAIPSMGGGLAMTVFNLTDTYFVSKLGTDALAAMGFTFPVVMIVSAMSMGLSLGAGSVLARALGSNNHHKMHRAATDGILLSLIMVIFISIFGYTHVEDIFRLLGAEGESLRLVKEYMSIWFACAAVVVIPPVSDASMRAFGDMIRPFVVMLTVALLNVVLDPILIFGLFGFPAMGIRGAITATVISRALGGALSLGFVGFHYRLLDLKYKSLSELITSWKEIIHIGIPSIFVRLLPQAIRAAMTRLTASTVGVTAVAAIAAGQRIESFATIISMGIGTAIVPIVGQNFGKGNYQRVLSVRSLLIRIAVFFGLLFFIVTLPLGHLVARIFTDDPEVVELTVIYIRFIMIGSIGLNHYNWISEAFNAVGKPHFSMFVNVAGTLILIIPALLIGSFAGAFSGMLTGLVVSQIIVGIGAIWLSKERLA